MTEPNSMFAPLATLASALATGATTSRELVETALARIEAPAGQGAVVFTQVDAARARAAADACDVLRRAGTILSPLMGIPVSIKDLFDIAGQVTRAGSQALAANPPADRDADAVLRLRHAGAVFVGRTNMSEFAFSGIGLNPHYGHPAGPYGRAEPRVSGGSSSGAAASVADGMAAVALGTDTGGSVRIPSALCGLTGFKPTARRVSTRGAVPLSSTLDSIGPLGVSVACCALVDRVLAGQEPRMPEARPVAGMRIGVLNHIVTDDLDAEVSAAYQDALARLARAGARLVDLRFEPLERLADINRVSLSSMEAYAWHRPWLATQRASYDPRVLRRILYGETASAATYLDLLAERRAMIAAATPVWDQFDAVACPTVPITAPRIAQLVDDDAAFTRANGLMLRNPSITNFLDGCALSLPCQPRGGAPVGLMLSASAGRDDALLSAALGVEAVLGTRH